MLSLAAEWLVHVGGIATMSMAPLALVPWVPWNPSIFEQWVPEPIDFGKNGLQFTLLSSKYHFVVKSKKLFTRSALYNFFKGRHIFKVVDSIAKFMLYFYK